VASDGARATARRRGRPPRPRAAAALAAAILVAGPTTAARAVGAPAVAPGPTGAHWTVVDPGQGIVRLRAPGTGTIELSGLAWVQGDHWLAVSDRLASLHPVRIEVAADGRIADAVVHPGPRIEGARDPEGIAYAPDSATVFVSDEDGPAIREVDPATGRLRRDVSLPEVFARSRRNLGLESLSRDPATGVGWTANEEALATDGPRTTGATGTLVRLQRFDRDWRPDGQWAWRTEPSRAGEGESNGVSELVALPDGGLLVLERGEGPDGIHVALWEADLGSAADVQASGALPPDPPVLRKHLLWQAATGRFDFEGAALGPMLPDGGRSLVLVSDDGRGGDFGLYPLVLRPREPAAGIAGTVDEPRAPTPPAARRTRSHPPLGRRPPAHGAARRLRPTAGLLPR